MMGDSPTRGRRAARMQIAEKVGAKARERSRSPEPQPEYSTPHNSVEIINPDGSFSRGGSFNRRHFVEDPRKQAEEIRKSKELAEILKMQMEERQQFKKRSVERERSHERLLASSPDQFGSSPSPATHVANGRRAGQPVQQSHSVEFAPQDPPLNPQFSYKHPQYGPTPKHGYDPHSSHNSALKAAPDWLDDIPKAVSTSFGNSGDNVVTSQSQIGSMENVNAQNGAANPLRHSGEGRISPVFDRPLFDHERRALEEQERQKLAIERQEELRIALEKQIADKKRRKMLERQAELDLELELERRAKEEAELLRQQQQRELRRERGESPSPEQPAPPPPPARETELEKRKRHAREAAAAAESSNEPIALPEKGRRSSPTPSVRQSHDSIPQESPNGPHQIIQGMSPEREREIMVSLEMIKKELMEQRKYLHPLTPSPMRPQKPIEVPPMSSTPQPYFTPGLQRDNERPHPAAEILERNRSRLGALRYAKHHDDILKAFLLEDQTRSQRMYEKHAMPSSTVNHSTINFR